jgi:hypothetical protein
VRVGWRIRDVKRHALDHVVVISSALSLSRVIAMIRLFLAKRAHDLFSDMPRASQYGVQVNER